jgi:hypothetical protein
VLKRERTGANPQAGGVGRGILLSIS